MPPKTIAGYPDIVRASGSPENATDVIGVARVVNGLVDPTSLARYADTAQESYTKVSKSFSKATGIIDRASAKMRAIDEDQRKPDRDREHTKKTAAAAKAAAVKEAAKELVAAFSGPVAHVAAALQQARRQLGQERLGLGLADPNPVAEARVQRALDRALALARDPAPEARAALQKLAARGATDPIVRVALDQLSEVERAEVDSGVTDEKTKVLATREAFNLNKDPTLGPRHEALRMIASNMTGNLTAAAAAIKLVGEARAPIDELASILSEQLSDESLVGRG